MTQQELKILEKVEQEIKEKVDFCFSQMAFCRRHKFEMEAAALEYRGEAYHQCRLKVMNAIDELKAMKGGENETRNKRHLDRNLGQVERVDYQDKQKYKLSEDRRPI